ncbi:MAG: hypothetical protein KDC78_03115 [Aequorivita sp.]|nr:hypothetical protein [Aequorivita sp.]
MKTPNILFLISACLFFTFSVKAQEENDEQKRDRVEKNTKPFNMNYFSKAENSFYVLEANVANNKIVIDSTATILVVPGKLPYPSGNFKVSVLDNQGEKLTEYFIQDPLIARSCDGESNNLSPLETGRISIVLPKNNAIATLIFTRDKERVDTVDISDLIERTQRDPNNGGQ